MTAIHRSMHMDLTFMFIFYDFIFLVYTVIYLPYLVLTRRGYKGYRMRFGFFSPQLKAQISAKANIWVHAVSVGEVMLIDGFIDRLKEKYPAHQVVVTVTTKTGYKIACDRLKLKAVVVPSPLDFSFITGYFVGLIKPRIYIVAETEIWPNLYAHLYHQKIPIAVINGRISDRSFGRYQLVSFVLKGILNKVSVWCMQSQADAQRICQLGAKESRVVVTGNIKFDQISTVVKPSTAVVKAGNQELWWVAGSTHEGEEEIVLDVYTKMLKDDPNWSLVIVPRHIERAGQILELVKSRGYHGVRFSELDGPFGGGEGALKVIVVDTIGHLRLLYLKADLVFVGKSLCVGGGHNIIEPAVFGKAIIVGPRVENFRDIAAIFKSGNALVQAGDAISFEMAVRELAKDASRREKLGGNARAVIAANQGATGRTLDRLSEFLT